MNSFKLWMHQSRENKPQTFMLIWKVKKNLEKEKKLSISHLLTKRYSPPCTPRSYCTYGLKGQEILYKITAYIYWKNLGTKCKRKIQPRDFYFMFQTVNGILLLPRIKCSCYLTMFWIRTISFPSVFHCGVNMCKTFDKLFHLVTLSVSHHVSFQNEKCGDYLQKMLNYWSLPEQAKKLVL